MSPVGKILTKPPLFEAQSHSPSRFTAKRKGKLKSFPTASLRTDFSHSLGQKQKSEVTPLDVCFNLKTGHSASERLTTASGRKSPLGVHGWISSPERRETAEAV